MDVGDQNEEKQSYRYFSGGSITHAEKKKQILNLLAKGSIETGGKSSSTYLFLVFDLPWLYSMSSYIKGQWDKKGK